jgi:hypothetical protein
MVIKTLSSLYGKYAGTNYLDDILRFVRWLFCGDILFAEVMYRLKILSRLIVVIAASVFKDMKPYQAGRVSACIRMRVRCVTATSAFFVAFLCFTPMFVSIPQVFRQTKLKPFLCIPVKSDLLIISAAGIGTQVAEEKCVVCSFCKKKKVTSLRTYAPRMMTQCGLKV